MAAKLLLGDPMVETKQTNSQFKSKKIISQYVADFVCWEILLIDVS